jgi:hypothetical protein
MDWSQQGEAWFKAGAATILGCNLANNTTQGNNFSE